MLFGIKYALRINKGSILKSYTTVVSVYLRKDMIVKIHEDYKVRFQESPLFCQ